ncbi:MAG: hypothetical protein ABSF13_09195 [Smithella sp.]
MIDREPSITKGRAGLALPFLLFFPEALKVTIPRDRFEQRQFRTSPTANVMMPLQPLLLVLGSIASFISRNSLYPETVSCFIPLFVHFPLKRYNFKNIFGGYIQLLRHVDPNGLLLLPQLADSENSLPLIGHYTRQESAMVPSLIQ